MHSRRNKPLQWVSSQPTLYMRVHAGNSSRTNTTNFDTGVKSIAGQLLFNLPPGALQIKLQTERLQKILEGISTVPPMSPPSVAYFAVSMRGRPIVNCACFALSSVGTFAFLFDRHPKAASLVVLGPTVAFASTRIQSPVIFCLAGVMSALPILPTKWVATEDR